MKIIVNFLITLFIIIPGMFFVLCGGISGVFGVIGLFYGKLWNMPNYSFFPALIGAIIYYSFMILIGYLLIKFGRSLIKNNKIENIPKL